MLADLKVFAARSKSDWHTSQGTYYLVKVVYGKCIKISYTKVSDKMAYANSADPDQTAPERSSLIRVYTVCHSTKYFKKELHKKQNLGQKSME